MKPLYTGAVYLQPEGPVPALQPSEVCLDSRSPSCVSSISALTKHRVNSPMLSLLLVDSPRDWRRESPFLLCAMRRQLSLPILALSDSAGDEANSTHTTVNNLPLPRVWHCGEPQDTPLHCYRTGGRQPSSMWKGKDRNVKHIV